MVCSLCSKAHVTASKAGGTNIWFGLEQHRILVVTSPDISSFDSNILTRNSLVQSHVFIVPFSFAAFRGNSPVNIVVMCTMNQLVQRSAETKLSFLLVSRKFSGRHLPPCRRLWMREFFSQPFEMDMEGSSSMNRCHQKQKGLHFSH